MRFSPLVLVGGLCLAWLSELPAQDVTITTPPHQWQNLHLPVETWGTVMFEAKNTGEEPHDWFLTTYFEQNPNQQFGRRFWIPPNSVRDGWFLVKTPPTDGSGKETEAKTLRSMSIHQHGAIEASAEPQFGERYETSFIRCKTQPAQTLLLVERRDREVDQLVTAARISRPNPQNFQVSASRTLPPEKAALDRWSHIILATDRIHEDLAAVEALRQWVAGGGKLWILLDKTGIDPVLPLIGDAGGLTLVDRVGLTSFRMTSSMVDFGASGRVRELERPAELVRVVIEGFRVLGQIDGWDAAFSTQVGRGTVFVTALSPHGWLQSQREWGRWKEGLLQNGYPTEECASLGEIFWGGPRTKPEVEVAGIATNFVGYRVTSLARIAGALAVFCILVLAVSLVLWRTERLTWLAWFAPVSATCASLFIGISGYRERTAIPPTEAVIQLAEADSLGQVHVEGGMSVYSVSSGDTLPEVQQGGRLEFLDPPVGTAKRMVWSDYSDIHWENLDLNTGVHELRFESFETREPTRAVLSLNEAGVTGRISGGDWDLPERGLIVSGVGRFAAPRFSEDGRLESTSADSLTPGHFSASDVIGDRELTRAEVLKAYFSDERPLPIEPRLYFWTKPLEMGLKAQADGRRVGDALVGLPIVFEPPPAGSNVYCPPYLIRYRSVTHRGRGSSLAYNNRTRVWTDLLLRAGNTTLEFGLPRDLGEMTLERVRLSVDLNAPDRTLELVALDRTKPETIRTLETRKSPVGLIEFDLEGESLPAVDENLMFRVGLDVGPLLDDPAQEADADRARHAWQFRGVWAEVWGRTPE